MVAKVDSGGYWELVLPAKTKRKLWQGISARETAQQAEVDSLRKQLKKASSAAVAVRVDCELKSESAANDKVRDGQKQG